VKSTGQKLPRERSTGQVHRASTPTETPPGKSIGQKSPQQVSPSGKSLPREYLTGQVYRAKSYLPGKKLKEKSNKVSQPDKSTGQNISPVDKVYRAKVSPVSTSPGKSTGQSPTHRANLHKFISNFMTIFCIKINIFYNILYKNKFLNHKSFYNSTNSCSILIKVISINVELNSLYSKSKQNKKIFTTSRVIQVINFFFNFCVYFFKFCPVDFSVGEIFAR
jgi:hypothetical protein